jgi:diguanylate cyclase (GGDEF)-like protein
MLAESNGTVAVTTADDRRVSGLDPFAGERLNLLLADFARVLDCDVALVCELDPGRTGRTLASWGIDRGFAISVPRDGGRLRRRHPAEPGGSFVGRALVHGRPAFEVLDPGCDAALIEATPAPLTHGLAVPLQPLDANAQRVLMAGFSTAPAEPGRAFWVADAYAQLIALLVHAPDALTGFLEHSRCDGLTGCLTYDSVLGDLTREINRSARSQLPLSCCFVDLDGFKRVNDEHGHLRGNEVLAGVGRVLRGGVRSCDTVGRYGGDEFIVILPQTNQTEAVDLATRLRASIAGWHAERLGRRLSASIGVAQWTAGMPIQQLLARADNALFVAKSLPDGVASYPSKRAASPPGTASARPNGSGPGQPTVDELLDTIEEFSTASAGLVAWELSCSDDELRPVWDQALKDDLIEPAGVCPVTAEEMFALSARMTPARGRGVTPAGRTNGA